MKRIFTPAACAVAILLSSASVDAILAPAAAQTDVQVDFDTFHDQLASYGDWVYSDRWGEVWIPSDVPDNFQPYGTNGYWAYTEDYGWTWASDYEWGDIPFHYGRWVNDPDNGWLWIPGYVWSPAWVVWRSNGQYIGWMPMPPDREFLEGGSPSFGISVDFGNTGGYYGYSQWYGRDYDESRFASNWVFVGTAHLADRDFARYQAPRANYENIIRITTNATHYSVVNNYVVNKGIDPGVVQRAGGHPVPIMHLNEVIKKPQFIMHADQGREVQQRMRTQMPRGTGVAESAPKPSAQVVQSLSTKVTPHAGHPAAHLYTRDTVSSAPLAKPNVLGGGMAPSKPTAAPGRAAPGVSPSGEKPADHSMDHPADHERRPPTPADTTAPANAPANGMASPERHHTTETAPGPTSAPPETTAPRHRHENETTPANPAAAPATTRPPMPPRDLHPTAPPPVPATPPKPVEHPKERAATPPPAKPDKPDKKDKHEDDKPQ